MNARAVRQKLQRIRAGGKAPRVLDLFAGCGGFSLGFKRGGYDVVAAVEFDASAAQSHGENFHSGEWRHALARDITLTPPLKLAEDLSMGDVSLAVDVLIGGPPCQAFARVGRSKLREVAEHPEAFRHDSRARLYIEYLRYVEAFAPLAVVMENVPDMLNHGGHNLAEEIAEVLEAKGYVCSYSLFNAAFYGVPQMRERMVLIAVHRDVASEVRLPTPTNWIELPQGYVGSRAVALKLLSTKAGSGGRHHYVEAPAPTPTLDKAVTTKDAIGDLPQINAMTLLREGVLKRGRKGFDVAVPYNANFYSSYVQVMRKWPEYEGKAAVYDHVIRYLPRDYKIFAGLQPGDQYPEAHRYALTLFEKQLAALRDAGADIPEGSEEWQSLRAKIVPPYDASKFPNKWRKMEANQPARTLLAHLGKDGYSHIHYDSNQARPISVREAARLQSFPDGFRFAGTMNPAFRQIGNAVPPLLAWHVASTLKRQLMGVASDLDVDAQPARSRIAT
ncbi:cytosine-specific methyltransferase [Rhizobium sp. NBRC 114257]|uniref:DNA (cytosine-5-)-methyltransferase n=1 Tax=Rhizobium dioscoreae TaxID=2653122 RepID=A0ABQ0Z3B0_9HYPH|nr:MULTISPECIES: DNA cytosine methyltransferase [Rhizobium]GES49979.1 cytosine-specific methyltransferase [Rhizobium dioscoreae]GLU82261.1 cytosine-specific methyltransferase [Rhizobium sp. NBRC 114257]